MVESLVITNTLDRVSWLHLNRPNVSNALNNELLDALDLALESASKDPKVRVVVIEGRGRNFCIGGDIEFMSDSTKLLDNIRRAITTFDRIRKLKKPVIAAVHGHAIGGGLELLLSCDLVIAAASAKIGDGHAKLGAIPAGGSIIRISRFAGPAIAKYLALSGNSVQASDLLRYGLINEVVPDSDLHNHVARIAEELSTRSPRVLSATKQLIADALEQSVSVSERSELQTLELHMNTCSDFEEGLAALKEKRQPIFAD